MERPSQPERLTGDQIIEAGISEWRSRNWEGVISDTVARIIASQYHPGQGSALYSFASTGAIDMGDLYADVFRAYSAALEERDEWSQHVLDAFTLYLVEHGNRDPVPGWHENTKWGHDQQDAADIDNSLAMHRDETYIQAIEFGTDTEGMQAELTRRLGQRGLRWRWEGPRIVVEPEADNPSE